MPSLGYFEIYNHKQKQLPYTHLFSLSNKNRTEINETACMVNAKDQVDA